MQFTKQLKNPPFSCLMVNYLGQGTKQAGNLPGDATNPEALQTALRLGLTSFGVGAAARSILGLRDMVAKSFSRRRPPVNPAVVEIAVPTVQEEDPEDVPKRRRASLFKQSQTSFNLPDNIDFAGTDTTQVSDFLKGRHNVNKWTKPWFPLAVGALGVGGLTGGYSLVDTLLNRLHKKDRSKELEEAKEDYRKAIIEQYNPETVKRASTDDLGKDLDTLYLLTKEASTGLDILGGLTGGYLPIAALLGGGSAAATYNWVKARSPEERLAKAIRQRERLRWATRPPEIYAVTKPVPVRVAKQLDDPYSIASPDEEETVRKVTTEKLAALYKP